MSSKVRALASAWFVLTVLAIWVTATNAGQGVYPGSGRMAPQWIYGDSCSSTCPPLEQCVTVKLLGTCDQDCCVWDWGCWLNPAEPNYQDKPCKRQVWACVWPQPIDDGVTSSGFQ